MEYWDLLFQPIPKDTIIKLAQVFALANALLSLMAHRLLERRAFSAFKTGFISLYSGITAIWLSIVLCVVAAVLCETVVQPKLIALCVRLSVVLWLLGLIVIFCLALKGFRFDTRPFRKPPQYDAPNGDTEVPQFGIKDIDKIAEEARSAGSRIRFPMMIVGNEETRIWRVAQHFTLAALKSKRVVIYFAFSRPGKSCLEQLLGLRESEQFSDLHLVDCYGGMYYSWNERRRCKKEINKLDKNVNLYFADPRDPAKINKIYHSIVGNHLKRPLTVVYEAFSDFMYLTDREIAMNFLRSQVGWEEANKVQSMYVVRPGMIDKSDESQIIWFLNSKLEFTYKKPEPSQFNVTAKMIFPEPKTYEIRDREAFFGKGGISAEI